MPRTGKEARDRLRRATLELFEQRGYDATTTAEIAARAGVTERTFFRHFADKREALFDGEEGFTDTFAEAIIAVPVGATPMDALIQAFRSVEPVLQQNRPFTAPRQAIIARTPALQERVRTKTTALTVAMTAALVRRGVGQTKARLAAEIAMAVIGQATSAWLNDLSATLSAHLDRTLADLRELVAAL